MERTHTIGFGLRTLSNTSLLLGLGRFAITPNLSLGYPHLGVTVTIELDGNKGVGLLAGRMCWLGIRSRII